MNRAIANEKAAVAAEKNVHAAANGLETNRKALEDMLLYTFEQGLTRRLLTVDELFVPVA